jgi:hypothetical protein
MDQDDYAITEAMLRYGGSFVAALAKAFRAGDRENQQRLKDTFPHYWQEYAALAQQQRET